MSTCFDMVDHTCQLIVVLKKSYVTRARKGSYSARVCKSRLSADTRQINHRILTSQANYLQRIFHRKSSKTILKERMTLFIMLNLHYTLVFLISHVNLQLNKCQVLMQVDTSWCFNFYYESIYI